MSIYFSVHERCELGNIGQFEKELRSTCALLEEVSDVVIYGRTYDTHNHSDVIKKVIKDVIILEESTYEVLRKLCIRKLWIGTPYIKERTLEEVGWWKEKGFEILGFVGLGKKRGVVSQTHQFSQYIG